jgi:hypothetical protein
MKLFTQASNSSSNWPSCMCQVFQEIPEVDPAYITVWVDKLSVPIQLMGGLVTKFQIMAAIFTQVMYFRFGSIT